jgi:hypothetical protein
VALRLARAGYGGGDPEKVLQMRADTVVMAIQYETFRAEYEAAFMEINKPKER